MFSGDTSPTSIFHKHGVSNLDYMSTWIQPYEESVWEIKHKFLSL